jgi:hypothetical protein
MRTWILGTAIVVALVGVGCGDDDDTADDNDGGGDSGDSGNGGSSGTSADRGDGGPNSGGGGTGVVVGDGTQFTGCRSNADCDPGLNCYTFGGYCSAQCSGNDDCSSLGANAGCYQAGGGMMGGFFGGMMGGAGGATGSGGASGSTTTGTCRVSCTGVDDTSCPTGLMCIDVGAGSFRCALPGADSGNTGSGGAGGIFGGAGGAGFFGGSGGRGGMMQMPGDTKAFEECTGGGCVEGLTCSSTFGRGFCTQTCQNTSDCTEEPGSGDVTPTCGRNGRCVLECTVDADECPDDMTCTRPGGGGPGNNNGEDGGAPLTGRCNYTN